MAYSPNLSYGGGSDKFGHQDYIGNLKSIWDQGGSNRQKNLMKARQDMLSWMGQAENINKIYGIKLQSSVLSNLEVLNQLTRINLKNKKFTLSYQ